MLKNQISPNWRIRSFARSMRRKKATKQEIIVKQLLKSILKKKHLRFHNQFPIYDQKHKKWYIVDFYIPKIKLVIEVDGHHHQTKESQVYYDQKRTRFLKSMGLTITRITNLETKSPKLRTKLNNTIHRHVKKLKLAKCILLKLFCKIQDFLCYTEKEKGGYYATLFVNKD